MNDYPIGRICVLPVWGLLLSLLLLLAPTLSQGAGNCSSRQPQGSCSPACDSSCNYYTFNGQVSSGTIGQLPFSLASLKPGGNYCDLEGEGQIDQTMQQIPFTIGPYTITQLPHTLNLNYKTYTQQTNHGPACPPPPVPSP